MSCSRKPAPPAPQADVVVPVYAEPEVTRRCLESVLAHSGEALGRLVVVEDRSPDPAMGSMLEELYARDRRLVLLRNEENLGFVASVNRGMAVRERDVVLLNSDTLVTPGWLAELCEVARASDRIAAVVPLSNNATIFSVPEYGRPTPVEALQGAGLKLEALPRYTLVPTGVGFCLLLKDLMLNMIGLFDPAYGRGYHEENDWCARAQQLGFTIARANRALVYHLGQVSFGEERSELDRRNGHRLVSRYPHYLRQNQVFEAGPEARLAAQYVKQRLSRPAVCVDATHLGSAHLLNGTGLYALELIRALARRGEVEVAARVSQEEQRRFFAELGIRAHQASAPLDGFQAFHRPAQVFRSEDLSLFLQAPCHSVLTFQDLIAFRAPSVLASYDEVTRYRALSFAALRSAQAVIAISEHDRQELLHTFHLPPERVHTVHQGIDAGAFSSRDEGRNRAALAKHGLSGPYFLHAGSDYPHENLRLLLAGYALYRGSEVNPARLVLVGPPSHSQGSLYDRTAEWPVGVSYLGELPAQEVRALYQEAQAFVFPSAYEGFGLPALEAMAAGIPLIASSLTALPEVAGEAALYLRSFSPDELAEALRAVSTQPRLREELVSAGRRQLARFSWDETARKTAEVYRSVIEHPAPESLFSRQMLAHLFGMFTESEARWRALVA